MDPLWGTTLVALVLALLLLPSFRLRSLWGAVCVPVVAALVIAAFSAVTNEPRSWEQIGGGRWWIAGTAFVVGTVVLWYQVAKGPRRSTVRSPLDPTPFPNGAALLAALAYATAYLSLTTSDLRAVALPALAAAFLVGLAGEVSKRAFRVSVLVTGVAALLVIGAVGVHQLQVDAAEAARTGAVEIDEAYASLVAAARAAEQQAALSICVPYASSATVEATAGPEAEGRPPSTEVLACVNALEVPRDDEALRPEVRRADELESAAPELDDDGVDPGAAELFAATAEVRADAEAFGFGDLRDGLRSQADRLASTLAVAVCTPRAVADEETNEVARCREALAPEGPRLRSEPLRLSLPLAQEALRETAEVSGLTVDAEVIELVEHMVAPQEPFRGTPPGDVPTPQAVVEEILERVDLVRRSVRAEPIESLRDEVRQLEEVLLAMGLEVPRARVPPGDEQGPFAEVAAQADQLVAIRTLERDLADARSEAASFTLSVLEATQASPTTSTSEDEAQPAGQAAGAASVPPAEATDVLAAQQEVEVSSERLEAAAEALDVAREARSATPNPPVDQEIDELVATGVDVVVGAATAPALGGEIGLVVGVAGYLVAGLLLLIGYRQLEIKNNQRYGAPVEVAPVLGVAGSADGKADEQAEVTQRLRERILSVGLDDPGPAPGAFTTARLREALSEAEGLPQNKLASAIVGFVQAVAFPPAGVKVTTAVRVRPDGAHEASVELSTRVAERFVGSSVVTAGDRTALIDAVAYLVATNCLTFSQTTPAWAAWQDEKGEALRCYRDGSGPPDGSDEDALAAKVRLLERAVRLSPLNGQVRVELAKLRGSAGEPTRALRLFLETVIAHPTMATARYGVATSLLLVAEPDLLADAWAPGSERDDVVQLLDRRYAEPGAELPDLRSSDAGLVAQRLRWLALLELWRLERELTLGWILVTALRPRERSRRLELLRDRRARAAHRSLYRTVQLAAALKMAIAGKPLLRSRWGRWFIPRTMSGESSPWPGGRGGRWHRGRLARRTWDVPAITKALVEQAPWTRQVSPKTHYAAACTWATLAEAHDIGRAGVSRDLAEARRLYDLAFRHFEEALRAAGPQFRREWLEMDPDLEPLRRHQGRFDELLDAYVSGGEPGPAGGGP